MQQDGAALSRVALTAYAMPILGFQAASLPISLWFGKFATDTLLMPAAAMGAIVMLARIWDGISDPLAGHLSDRTRSRYGRRRSWMLASILPIALALVALWTPPPALEGLALILWMGVAYVLWETASTALLVPYAALGNEITPHYHERTRLFAWRHVLSAFGYVLALLSVFLLRTSAEHSTEAGRQTATWLAVAAGLGIAVAVLFAVRQLPEPAEHQARGGARLLLAFGDVFRNPHARVLLAVYTIEAFGMGSISFLAPYVLDDVLGQVAFLEIVLVCWVVPQFALTPLWLRLSRRFGKRDLWLLGMGIYAVGFAANVFVAGGGLPLLIGVVLLLGAGGGIGNIVVPSIQADVIDWDELQTGERKEGAYTAVWNLIRKLGWGLAAGLGGLALGIAGYDGAAEQQSARVQWTIVALVSVLPAAAYAVGALALSRFDFDEAAHRRVREALEARHAADPAEGPAEDGEPPSG